MIPRYTIEYTAPIRKHSPVLHYSTDDPVACEEFIQELLNQGLGIRAIKHDGVDLAKPEFDRIVKTAAGMLAAQHIRMSLGIDAEEERYRFGFAS